MLPTQPKTPQTCCKLPILPACCNLSTCCNKLVNFIKLQQVCRNQLVETTCTKPVDITFGQSTCIKSVDNLQDLTSTNCRKPCERILMSACCNKLLQDVNGLFATCAFLAVDSLSSFVTIRNETEESRKTVTT